MGNIGRGWTGEEGKEMEGATEKGLCRAGPPQRRRVFSVLCQHPEEFSSEGRESLTYVYHYLLLVYQFVPRASQTQQMLHKCLLDSDFTCRYKWEEQIIRKYQMPSEIKVMKNDN